MNFCWAFKRSGSTNEHACSFLHMFTFLRFFLSIFSKRKSWENPRQSMNFKQASKSSFQQYKNYTKSRLLKKFKLNTLIFRHFRKFLKKEPQTPQAPSQI